MATTGNVARRLMLIPQARNYLLNDPDIPSSMQVILKGYGKRLAVILGVISSKKPIQLNFFKQYCIATYQFLIKSFPCTSVTPTVHKVLAHGWELIEKNDGCGLGSLDESGQLALNQRIKF